MSDNFKRVPTFTEPWMGKKYVNVISKEMSELESFNMNIKLFQLLIHHVDDNDRTILSRIIMRPLNQQYRIQITNQIINDLASR